MMVRSDQGTGQNGKKRTSSFILTSDLDCFSHGVILALGSNEMTNDKLAAKRGAYLFGERV
jgi:hypothetical protein